MCKIVPNNYSQRMKGKKSIVSISVAPTDQVRHSSSDNEIKEKKTSFEHKKDPYYTKKPFYRRNTVDVIPSSRQDINDNRTNYDDASNRRNSTSKTRNINAFTKLFWYVISGKEDECVNYYCGLYGFLCLTVVFAIVAVPLLIPMHNVIEKPEYWYELPAHYTIENFCGYTLLVMFASSIVLKTEYTTSWKAFWYIFVCSSLTFVFPYIIIHVVWVYWVQYNPPMPFVGYICGVLADIGSCLSLYTVLPISWHQDVKMQKRLRALLQLIFLFMLISLEYLTISYLIWIIHEACECEWILALFLPLTKYVNEKLVINTAYVASGGKDTSTKFVTSCYVVTGYKLFLVLLVKSSSSDSTNYIILVSEFIINMYLCIEIIILHLRGKASKKELEEEVLNYLVLKETIECMVPFAFMGTFSMAYYGPNRSIIGNADKGNSYWHYTELEAGDMEKLLRQTSLFFLIDFLSAIISHILLWKICRINFYLAYCKMINKFWWITALVLARQLHKVSNNVFLTFTSL